MATMPPPYSPRDARRQARDAARFQRAQMRAQFAMLRRRPSFVGPLLLIATGVIALLLETGRIEPSAFWPFYARWWPALLVLVGLGLLVEYFVDRNNPQPGRRSLGGIFWLILLLSFAGFASHGVAHFAPWGEQFSDTFGDGNWMSMMGQEHDNDVTLARPIASGGTLTIDNARGDVAVSSAEGGEVTVAAHQVVHTDSDTTAQRGFDATRPRFEGEGAAETISVPGQGNTSVDLKITAPAGVSVIVRTNHGDVALAGIRRNLDVNLSHGDVTIDDAGAAVHLKMDHGDVIVRGVGGDLTVDGHADDITVSGVKGNTLLDGDFFGDTRIDGAGQAVRFHSSRTELDVPKLAGEMTINRDDLRLVQPSGGLRLVTRSKNVEVTDLVGDARIEDSNDDVNITAGMPLGNLQVTDRTGAVVVTVPSNASFSVHAMTDSSDELNSDFGLPTQQSGGRKILNGQVGQGGPHLDIDTDHGDLSLHRGGERAQAPERPETPGAPERRLHTKGAEPQPIVQ